MRPRKTPAENLGLRVERVRADLASMRPRKTPAENRIGWRATRSSTGCFNEAAENTRGKLHRGGGDVMVANRLQ